MTKYFISKLQLQSTLASLVHLQNWTRWSGSWIISAKSKSISHMECFTWLFLQIRHQRTHSYGFVSYKMIHEYINAAKEEVILSKFRQPTHIHKYICMRTQKRNRYQTIVLEQREHKNLPWWHQKYERKFVWHAKTFIMLRFKTQYTV